MIGLDFGDSSDEDETFNIFLNHMRKCFIAIDDERFCEYILVPEVEKISIKKKWSHL